MQNRQRCLVGLLSLVVVVFALSSYGQTPTPTKSSDKPKTHSENRTQKSETNETISKIPSPPETLINSDQTNKETPNIAKKHDKKVPSDVWITRFTAALVAVGILQFIAMILQYCWMRKTLGVVKIQAETMQDELMLKKRSKIHVRDVAIPEFENPLGRQSFPNGQLSIVNLGGIAANIIEIGAWFETGHEKGLPTEWPDESEKPNVPNPQPTKLEVGQLVRYKFTDERRQWSSYEWVRMKPNEGMLYVIGYVRYTDETQLPRYSRFFREYRVLKGYGGLHKYSRRFFPVEGYEYEE